MASASTIRLQVEQVLAHRVPSALTPAPRIYRPSARTGIPQLDDRLQGGLPFGAVSELVGPECSGRTTLALSFVSQMTQASRGCAWVDMSNALDPFSAAAMGVDLNRLLWVRCGATTNRTQHAQSEQESAPNPALPRKRHKHWQRMEQGLRATDLILQSGGFSAIVMDMGSLPADSVTRVPLATWHRYRVAAEKTQSCIVLLTQHPCAQSSAALMLRLHPEHALGEETTLLAGMEHTVEIVRKRFHEEPSSISCMKKPSQPAMHTHWHSRTPWACCR